MNNYKLALEDILRHEGGYNGNLNKQTGTTELCASLRFLPGVTGLAEDVNEEGHVTEEDIRGLSQARAGDLYRHYFWDHYRLGEIHSQMVATKCLNCFVNMRGKTAGRVVQRALRCCGMIVKEDGLIGSISLEAINLSNEQKLLCALKSESAAIYRLIVSRNPGHKKFEDGWLNRAYN